MGSTVTMAKLLGLCTLCVIFATAALAATQNLDDEPRSSDVIDEILPREADLDLSLEDEDDEDDELLDRDDGEETGENEAQGEPSDRLSFARCCPFGQHMRFTRSGYMCRSCRRCSEYWVTGRCGGSRATEKATANINLGGTSYTVTLQKNSARSICSGLWGWRRRRCLRMSMWGLFGRKARRGLRNTRRKSRKTPRRSRKPKSPKMPNNPKRGRAKKQEKTG